ncbi:MAG: EAL domain-containing protein, partial [Clostridia bacterium]|nr:EAL domain-containing protein [Clostridia bacterium]
QLTFEKSHDWSGKIYINNNIKNQTFQVTWMDMLQGEQIYRLLFIYPQITLDEKLNIWEAFKKMNGGMIHEEGRLIKIEFFVTRNNEKLLMSLVDMAIKSIQAYFAFEKNSFNYVVIKHTMYFFTKCKDFHLYELSDYVLNSPEIEQAEFKNSCLLKLKIMVSSLGLFEMKLIQQISELTEISDLEEENRIYFYNKLSEYKKMNEINASIQSGIENKEFVLYAQSIVNIEEHEIEGFEVLIRWKHPKYGLLLPDDFLPAANRSGEIVHIDLYVVKKTFEFLHQHYEKLKDMIIHINLSNRTLSSNKFIQLVLERKYNYLRNNIVFELIEDQDSPVMDKVINQLRNNGYQLAIDDFGKGYSSFERIRTIGIEYIKIDKSFIDGLTDNVDDLLILQAIIGMCNNLQIKVIAEGIETQGQLEFLFSRQCMRIQGYIFSQPKPIETYLNIPEEDIQSIENISRNLLSDQIESKKFYNNSRIIRQDIDLSMNLITPSITLAEILGYDYSVFQQMTFLDLLPSKHVHAFKSFIYAYEKNNNYRAIMIEMLTTTHKNLKGICVIQKQKISTNYQVYIEFIDKNNEFELLGLSHSYLQAFREAPSGMVIVSSNYVIKNWNNACQRIFGYDSKMAINANIVKLIASDLDKEKFTTMFQSALKGGVVEKVIKNKVANGDVRIIRWHVDILYDELQEVQEYICIANDITDELKRNEQLSKINKALDQSESIILMTDKEGRFEYVNNKFYEVTGYVESEILGKHVDILSSNEMKPEFYADLWETIGKGLVWDGEFHNLKKDGSYYWCKSSIYPVVQDDEITGYVGIQVDITEQKFLENVNTELKQKLFEQDKIASVGMLSSGIIHEINNPLSFINGNIKYILDTMKDYKNLEEEDFEDLCDALKDVEVGVDQIKTIATGLKKYIFKGANDQKEPVDLVEEIKTILIVAKNEYKYHAAVNLIYEEGIHYKVYGYASKLKQVLMNLVINASHAIASMERESLGFINIHLLKVKDQIILKVEDNGSGMSEMTINKIYEPFFTTKEKGLGSGLGLSVTRQIIQDDHDGEILCESELGKGTTFTIKLKTMW